MSMRYRFSLFEAIDRTKLEQRCRLRSHIPPKGAIHVLYFILYRLSRLPEELSSPVIGHRLYRPNRLFLIIFDFNDQTEKLRDKI